VCPLSSMAEQNMSLIMDDFEIFNASVRDSNILSIVILLLLANTNGLFNPLCLFINRWKYDVLFDPGSRICGTC